MFNDPELLEWIRTGARAATSTCRSPRRGSRSSAALARVARSGSGRRSATGIDLAQRRRRRGLPRYSPGIGPSLGDRSLRPAAARQRVRAGAAARDGGRSARRNDVARRERRHDLVRAARARRGGADHHATRSRARRNRSRWCSRSIAAVSLPVPRSSRPSGSSRPRARSCRSPSNAAQQTENTLRFLLG